MVILHAFFALAAGFATIVLLGIGLAALMAKSIPSWAADEGRPQPGSPATGLRRWGGEPGSPATGLRRWGGEPGPVFIHLGASFLIAAAGGYVTALVADANPLVHVLALGIVVLALAALSALQSKGRQPIWFQLAQVAISPLGVLAGGLLRLRVLGIL